MKNDFIAIHEIRMEEFSSSMANGEATGNLKAILKQKLNQKKGKPSTITKTKQSLPNGKKLHGVWQRLWAANMRDPFLRAWKWLGTFHTAKEAALFYDREATRLRGADALPNLIKPQKKSQPHSPLPPSSNNAPEGFYLRYIWWVLHFWVKVRGYLDTI